TTSTTASAVPTTPTTTTAPTAPPTTVPPRSCLDQPLTSFDRIACRLGLLSQLLNSQADDALGGGKSARTLRGKLSKGSQLLDSARTKRKPVPLLRRAKKQVQAFRGLVQRGVRRKHIDPDFGRQVLGLALEAAGAIDDLRAAARTGAGS